MQTCQVVMRERCNCSDAVTRRRSFLAGGQIVTAILVIMSAHHAPGAQLKQWVMPPKVVDFTTSPTNPPMVYALPGPPVSNYAVANGLYDQAGNLLFYVSADSNSGSYRVYNRLGNSLGVLLYGPVFNGEIAVVPAPGDCTKVFLIHPFSDHFVGEYLYYSVLDMSANGGLGALPQMNVQLGYYAGGNTLAIAVSRPNLIGRFVYVVGYGQVDRYRLTSSGITLDGVVLSNIQPNDPIEADLSHDGLKFAWTNRNLFSGASATVLTLNPAGGWVSTSTFTLPTNGGGGLEFSPDGTKLYVAAGTFPSVPTDGIYMIPLPNGPPMLIPNSEPYGESQLELASDGRLYASSGTQLAALDDPDNFTININTFPSLVVPGVSGGLQQGFTTVRTLPDQIDGQDYDDIICPGCIAPPSGLVGWWPFDENTVPLHEIASSRPTQPGPNAGALGGASPAPVPGIVLGALEFDGVDDYVVAPASTSAGSFTFVVGDFTIDAWIRTSVSTGLQPIVDKRTTTTSLNPPVGYRLFLDDGFLVLGLADRTLPGETVFPSSSVNVADGDWHHVAGTVKRFTNSSGPAMVKLYVDGVLVGEFSPLGKSGAVTNNLADLYIGRGHAIGGPATYFDGRIDEVEIFRRALSQPEIDSIYKNSFAGKCKEFCYVNTYLSYFGGSGGIRLTICNGTGTTQSYDWSIAKGFSTGCTITGLGFNPAASTSSIGVLPGQCTSILINVTLPAGMTTTDIACYVATVTNVTDPSHPKKLHPCPGSLRKCNIVLCPSLPIDDSITRVQFSSEGTGGLAQLGFTLNREGDPGGLVAYRLTAHPAGSLDGPSIISLNDLPPGTPVEGSIDGPADGSATIDVTARYLEYQHFVPQEVTLWLDLDGDAEMEPVLSQGLISDSAPTAAEQIGACCDTLNGVCSEGIPEADCVGDQRIWTQYALCADVKCNADPGACCDQDVFGTCSVTTVMACDCEKCVWHKELTCEDIECLHNPIPTVSQWGLVVLTLLLLIGAKIYFARRRTATAPQ